MVSKKELLGIVLDAFCIYLSLNQQAKALKDEKYPGFYSQLMLRQSLQNFHTWDNNKTTGQFTEN